MRKSFALFITIILVTIFASLSISIVETKTISTNIDTLKYLHLQAIIHLKYIKEYILTHTTEQITNFSLDDTKFVTKVISKVDNNKTIYHISIESKDDKTLRIYSAISKD